MIIKNIKIKNFKGVLEQNVTFCSKQNVIEGDNGAGKTTILDAITWCLFGKNFADQQQFKIKPIIDYEEKNDLSTEVELIIEHDGREIVVQRIWAKDTTKILVDGTSFKVNEFKDFLEDKIGITEQEFKALTSVEYIPNLHWTALRALITSLVGDVSNEEILASGKYDLIKDKINSVGVDKTAQDIRESKTTINDKIKMITGNIDEKTKDIDQLHVDEEEEARLNDELNKLMIEQKKFEEKAANDIQKQQSIAKQQRDLADAKNVSKSFDEQISFNEERLTNYSIEFENVKKKDIASKEADKVIINNKIEAKKQDIARYKSIRTELGTQYNDLKEKEVKIENDKCSVCGQPLPKEKIDESLQTLKNKKIADMTEIVNTAKKYLESINNAEAEISELENKIIEIDKDIKNISARKLKDNELDDNQKAIKVKIDQLKIQKEEKDTFIKENDGKIEEFVPTVDKSSLEILNSRIKDITEKLAVSKVLDTFKEQLKELENKKSNYIAEKEILNDKEQQLIMFNNEKAEVLRQRIKDHFKLADFIVEEETKDGSKVETFKISYNGIEYAALNYGHKILIALDLITGIQNLKGKKMPILVDGLGELTRLPFLDTQVIGCRAKKQDIRSIELSTKEEE
jgi:DNA repair exonuclease SbcCD ATPase subunit